MKNSIIWYPSDLNLVSEVLWKLIDAPLVLTTQGDGIDEYWEYSREDFSLKGNPNYSINWDGVDGVGFHWSLVSPKDMQMLYFLMQCSRNFAEEAIIFPSEGTLALTKDIFKKHDLQFQPTNLLIDTPNIFLTKSNISIWHGMPNEFDNSSVFIVSNDQSLLMRIIERAIGFGEKKLNDFSDPFMTRLENEESAIFYSNLDQVINHIKKVNRDQEPFINRLWTAKKNN